MSIIDSFQEKRRLKSKVIRVFRGNSHQATNFSPTENMTNRNFTLSIREQASWDKWERFFRTSASPWQNEI